MSNNMTTNNNQKRERENDEIEDDNIKSKKLDSLEEIEFKPPPSINRNDDSAISFKPPFKPSTSKSSAKPSFGMSFNITTKVLPVSNESLPQQQESSVIKDEIVNNNNKPIGTLKPNTQVGPSKPNTQVGPSKPNTQVDPSKPLTNDSSSDSDSDSDDDNNEIDRKHLQQNIGPSKPNTQVGPSKPVGPLKPNTQIGPSRPLTNDSSSDSDSDSDDDNINNNQKTIGPAKPIIKDDDSSSDSDSGSDSDSDDDDDDSDDDEKEEIERWKQLASSLPISHEVNIKGHQRAVSSITIDPSGSRMITGSYDCKVKFWDFNGMDSSFRSFREIEPAEGTQVRSVQFNTGGDMFCVLPYTTQIRFYDRDGHFKDETVSGDRFIQDLYHTKGHVSILTSCSWHPTERDELISSSIDGTIRVWDRNQLSKNKSVIKSKNSKGSRIGVISCCYDQRGDIITGGMSDGTISMWDKRSNLLKPKQTISGAHELGTEVTSIQYNRDCYSMISRGMDYSLRVWDLRSPTKPIAVWDDLLCDYIETNCIFGSYDRVIVTGTSSSKGGFGSIVMYDLASLTKMRQIRVEDDVSVINCVWSTKLNQVFFGCSDSNVRGFYDPVQSTNGLKLCVSKAPRTKHVSDFEPDRPIITPNTLPLFRQTNPKKDKSKNNKKKKPSNAPEQKTSAKGPNLTQHLIKNTGLTNNTSWKEDARESFLRVASKKEKESSTNNNNGDTNNNN